ncbi:MAG: Do family serine endopeptidase [Pseudomonadota bacterium]
MNPSNSIKSLRSILLVSVVAVGAAGFSAAGTQIFSPNPALADAVKVEAPAVFTFADVVEAVSPAVVSVRVEAGVEPASNDGEFEFQRRGREFFEEFFRNGPRGDFGNDQRPHRKFGQSQGSGFFVSDDGYLVTNNHVIDNGSKFTVITSDGTELEASLIGTDPRTDLAVLKVKADKEFTYVDFGASRPRIGEWVVAVGNPFGLGGTVTAGIVSAHGREIGASRYDDFIQIDAAVNKGNSGGPAFNLKGEVIGVNTAIFSPSGGNVGIAFAIPAALADEIVTELIDNGSVTRGWLGVQIQPVTPEISESLGLDLENGTIVTSTQADSPAEEAGIIAGDIISKVDGKQIKGPKELARAVAGFDPDSEVDMTVWRDGEEQTVAVKLGKLQQASFEGGQEQAKPTRLKRLGLALEPTPEGLMVTDVRLGSRADEKGIRQGDVIVSVNGEQIESLRDLRSGLKSAREAGRKSALLQLKRQNGTVFVPVPLGRG